MEMARTRSQVFLAAATILLAITSPADAVCECPTFWTAFGSNCYRFFAVSLTWLEAEQFCQSFTVPARSGIDSFGHLVSIHSEAEQDFVYTFFETSTRDDTDTAMWLGFNDRTAEGRFQWTDGSPNNFKAWFDSNPDNHGSGEDCTQMVMGAGLNWIDLPCSSTRHYLICKMPFWE